MSSSWVTSDTFRPRAPSSPMIEPESARTKTAGRRVTKGAKRERKMSRSSKRMKTTDKPWVSFPVVFDASF